MRGEGMAGACVPPVKHAGFSVKISKVWVLFLPCKQKKKINRWTRDVWDYVL